MERGAYYCRDAAANADRRCEKMGRKGGEEERKEEALL